MLLTYHWWIDFWRVQKLLLVRFTGLNPGEMYRFRIAPINSAGMGPFSLPSFSAATLCARTSVPKLGCVDHPLYISAVCIHSHLMSLTSTRLLDHASLFLLLSMPLLANCSAGQAPVPTCGECNAAEPDPQVEGTARERLGYHRFVLSLIRFKQF
jgi:hypothetical protein